MSKVDSISVERLREVLDYNPDTGVLTWKVNTGKHRNKGKVAGSVKPDGRVVVCLDGVFLKAHRIAIALSTGAWPRGVVDHIDGNPGNNRLSNLRDTDQSVNCQNKVTPQRNNRSGLMGVSPWRKTWAARIREPLTRRVIRVGGFETPELAHEFYLLAKEMLHPGYVPRCTLDTLTEQR